MCKTSKSTKWSKQLAEYQGSQFRLRPKWLSESKSASCNTVCKTSNFLNKGINQWSSNHTRISKNCSKCSTRPNKVCSSARKFNWFPRPCANRSTHSIFWLWRFKSKFGRKNLRKTPISTQYVKKSMISWHSCSTHSRITISLDTNGIIKKTKNTSNHFSDRSLIAYIRFART